MERKSKDETTQRTQELKNKLDELRESREATEKALTDCRLRWERMKDEELKFADPEDVEGLLDDYENDLGLSGDPKQRTVAIEERSLFDRNGEKSDYEKDEKEHSFCSLLNLIWMELIGLVLTVYTFLRSPKRKM